MHSPSVSRSSLSGFRWHQMVHQFTNFRVGSFSHRNTDGPHGLTHQHLDSCCLKCRSRQSCRSASRTCRPLHSMHCSRVRFPDNPMCERFCLRRGVSFVLPFLELLRHRWSPRLSLFSTSNSPHVNAFTPSAEVSTDVVALLLRGSTVSGDEHESAVGTVVTKVNLH